MMNPTMVVVDASVVVKWLNRENELYVEEAKDMLMSAVGGFYTLVVSDVTVHEVFNALIRGKQLKGAMLKEAIETYFLSPLHVVQTSQRIAATAALIAEKDGVTFYDAVYCAVALEYDAPLITANPKHQRSREGIMVISLDQWFEHKKKVLV